MTERQLAATAVTLQPGLSDNVCLMIDNSVVTAPTCISVIAVGVVRHDAVVVVLGADVLEVESPAPESQHIRCCSSSAGLALAATPMSLYMQQVGWVVAGFEKRQFDGLGRCSPV
jgi:hypothetical protein